MKPFAWYDDGTCRAGSEATAHRVITDVQKLGMHNSTAKSFCNPLYTAASIADAQAEIARLRGELEKPRAINYDVISQFSYRENVDYNALCAMVREATQ